MHGFMGEGCINGVMDHHGCFNVIFRYGLVFLMSIFTFVIVVEMELWWYNGCNG